jgi:hypothetical protein
MPEKVYIPVEERETKADERRRKATTLLKIYAGVAVAVVAATFVWMVCERMSNDALAVLAGAVCGVGAAIPTSLLIVAVTRRADRPTPPAYTQPVVMMTPPMLMQQQQPQSDGRAPAVYDVPTGPRHYTVVGGGGGEGGLDGID